MALQLVIAGRHPLPRGKKLALDLSYDGPADDDVDDEDDIDEGSLTVWEDEGDDADFVASVAEVVGFTPASLLLIRPAGWELSSVVAEVLGRAVEGVVFCFGYDGPAIDHDYKGKRRRVATRRELVERVTKAFENPRPFFKRWAAQRQQETPVYSPENDWSDV